MRYTTIPVLTAPESAWNRLLAPIFDAVDRVTERRRSKRKATKPSKPVETSGAVEYADKTA